MIPRAYRTATRLFLLTALSVFTGEVLVMFILLALSPIAPVPEAFLDAVMLTALVVPSLYLFLFRPMMLEIEKREKAEAELRSFNETLEQRVSERTEELTAANTRLRREIETRQQAEDNLWKTSEFTRVVVESAPFLLLIYDISKGRCSFANSRLDDLLGYEPEVATSAEADFLERVLRPDDFARFLEKCRSAELAGKDEIEGEVLQARDVRGAWKSLDVRMVVLSRGGDDLPTEVLLSAVEAEET